MAKSAISRFGDEETCTDSWHSTLSIRQESCPSCRGTAKREDGGLGLAVAADVALGVLDAVSNSADDSDDDD